MPIIDIPNRVCPHCGGTEWYPYHRYYESGAEGTGYKCAKKVRESTYKNTPERLSENHKRWYHKNRKRVIARTSANRRTKRGKEIYKKSYEKSRDNLSPSYLRECFISNFRSHGFLIPARNITDEQIEMYRQSLLTQRKLKAIKNESKRQINSN